MISITVGPTGTISVRPLLYTPFHYLMFGSTDDWNNQWQVQNCELSNLAEYLSLLCPCNLLLGLTITTQPQDGERLRAPDTR